MSYAEDGYIEAMIDQFDRDLRKRSMSEDLRAKVGMYSVSEEDIKDFLFQLSLQSICKIADKVVNEYYPLHKRGDAETNTILDIIAKGMTWKYLTNKQKWRVAAFCIYWTRQYQRTNYKDELVACPDCRGTGSMDGITPEDITEALPCILCEGHGQVTRQELAAREEDPFGNHHA